MKQILARLVFFVLIGLVMPAGVAQADPIYQCFATNTSDEGASAVSCSSSHDTLTTGPPFGSGSVQATAGPGGLGVAASGFAKIDPIFGPANFSSGGSGNAEITFSDLIISGPGGGADVLAAMNFFTHLDNLSASLDSINSGSANIGASAEADWGVTFDDGNGNVYSATEFSQRTLRSNAGAITNSLDTYGDFTGNTDVTSLLAGSILTTPEFSLPVGAPITVTLFVGLGAGAGWTSCGLDCNGGSAGITFSALNTFGLPSTGLVFDLPAGYTVNSVDGLIVDNHFVGVAGEVPEPSSWPIVLTCFIAMVCAKRAIHPRPRAKASLMKQKGWRPSPADLQRVPGFETASRGAPL